MPRPLIALAAAVSLAACVGNWHPKAKEAAKRADEERRDEAPPASPDVASREPAGISSPPRPRARGYGVAPGDERGPGRFVSRSPEKCFYSASGGQLWYYLNLYYWAPEGLDTTDLWIREEVVEQWIDLRRWPDGAAAPSPPPKVTREYWEVGSTGRTVAIDNHKDFFFADERYCAGVLEVTMSLELGRTWVRESSGAWARPRAHYVLGSRDYGPEPRTGPKPSRFEACRGEPVTVWRYRIPWSSCPNRLTRSVWESLRVPSLDFVRRFDALPTAATAPVVTEAR